ncbi:unnamed protein product [Prunus armeniaca]|uniref:Uncharacterized protein n=1 Tax=Prunus armeniaca TaxID=36596 RepID=A0A6J5WSK4_PRUAR|nr:unnamed protein product [Prunus armeniaca]
MAGCHCSPASRPQLSWHLTGTVSQLGLGDLRSGPSGLALNRVDCLEKVNKWVCFNGLLGSPVLWRIRSVERTRSLPCQPMTCRGCKSDGAQCFQDIAYGFELFPKWVFFLQHDRLTASDLSATPHDGSKFRISFKGMPGAFTEEECCNQGLP